MHKVALITGAAQRIGAEIARSLHRNEYNLVLHYGRSSTEAQLLEKEFNDQRPGSAVCVQAELSKMTDLRSLAEQAISAWNRLDVLINNASRFYPTSIESVSEETWDDLINSNLRAPFFLSQALTRPLKKQRGCIINLVDIYAERPLKDYPVYSITKAGMAMLTKTLAKELGPDVRVNGISPGAILWPENAAYQNDEIRQNILERTALKTEGSPGDISQAVLFLIEQAPYVTGQIIAVDGGRTLNQ